MKMLLKIGKRAGTVLSLLMGFSWGITSYAIETSSDVQTGETSPACGSKTDAMTKVLQEEENPSSKSEEKGKSSAGSAKGSK